MAESKSHKERRERIEKICAGINKTYGEETVNWLGSGDSIQMERFPSGCPALDRALGGGWPRGRFIELYGPESGGKTTTLLHAIAEHQKKYPDEDCALIDTEFSFDDDYAKALGVNTEFVIVNQPDHGEQALQVLRDLIRSGVRCIGVDSVAALVPKAEIEGEIGDAHVGQQARLMSQTMRMLTGEASRAKCTIFWTNQVREKIGVTYGDKTTTPGGRALKFYAAIRVSIAAIAKVREGDEVVSNKVEADVKKNKTAPPFRKAQFYISFGKGIDRIAAIVDPAIELKILAKKGNTYSFVSPDKKEAEVVGVGRKQVMDAIRGSQELQDKVTAAVDNPEAYWKSIGKEPPAAEPDRKKPKGIGGDGVKRVPVKDEAAVPEGDEADGEGGEGVSETDV